MENLDQLEKLTDTTFLQGIIEKYLIPWGINLLLAIAIYVIGRMIVGVISRIVNKIMKKAGLDEILVNFLCGGIRMVLLAVVIIAALNQLGVDTTSLIAVLGAAGLAIGLALKDSLQNFASGVLLILFRPFNQGDFVEVAGVSGSVEKITIFSTIIKTPDNKEITVPNGSIYGSVITNYSARDTRRIDMVFGIGYDDDIKKAKDIIQQILDADERILRDPPAAISIAELADSSVNFNVRPWVNSPDYWNVRSDVIEQVKMAFDREGISIPFPQMDLHMKQSAA